MAIISVHFVVPRVVLCGMAQLSFLGTSYSSLYSFAISLPCFGKCADGARLGRTYRLKRDVQPFGVTLADNLRDAKRPVRFIGRLDARALFLDVLADELREEARIRSPLALQSSEHPKAILP